MRTHRHLLRRSPRHACNRCYDCAAGRSVTERLGMINTAASHSTATTPAARKTLCRRAPER